MGASERNDQQRTEFAEEQKRIDPRSLVVIDESGTNVAMTPTYARAKIGERAYDKSPKNHGTNVTLMGALSTKGFGATMVVEGPADEDVFCYYLERVLLPTLCPGKIIVLDNVPFHHSARARELVEGAKCKLLFLPAYSPDFSPIEEAFSKLKQILRRAKARTVEALLEAISRAIDMITPKDAKGWFRHCGYEFYWL